MFKVLEGKILKRIDIIYGRSWKKGKKYKTKIGHFNQRKQRKQFIETPLVNLTPPKKYSK